MKKECFTITANVGEGHNKIETSNQTGFPCNLIKVSYPQIIVLMLMLNPTLKDTCRCLHSIASPMGFLLEDCPPHIEGTATTANDIPMENLLSIKTQ